MNSTCSNPASVTIEVFRTNVANEVEATRVLGQLYKLYPSARINFDLEDCDKILRFQTDLPRVDVQGIIDCLRQFNLSAEVLE